MASEVLVALDQGSSSSRALAFDERGRIVARACAPIRTYYPRPGHVEHDAGELWRSSKSVLDQVLSRLPKSAKVAGLGIACQRSTVILWDSRTGRPAVRAPSWQDARAADGIAPLMGRQAEIHAKTGLYLTPYYSAPKVRHLLQAEAAVRELLAKGALMIAPVSTYLLWKLSRGKIFACDPSLAQRMLLYDLASGKWSGELLDLFGVPGRCLPAILPTFGDWGAINLAGREIPVLSCVGDQQAAAYGMGSRPGLGVLNFGTGAFFLLNAGQDSRRVPGLLTSVAWQGAGSPRDYLLEGTVHAAGTSLRWLQQLGLLGDPKKADAACRRSRRRLWTLPAIGGLGAPRWDYRTPTVFWGLGPDSRAEDLVRATVESIAFLVSDIVRVLREDGRAIEDIRVSGGLSRMDFLMRFQADILSMALTRLPDAEATALGAAALAAAAIRPSWADRLRVGGGKVFSPSLPPAEAGRLLAAWGIFAEAQRRLASEMESALAAG